MGGVIKIIDIGSNVKISDDIMNEKCVVCGKHYAGVMWTDMKNYYECKWCYGIFNYIWLSIKTIIKNLTFRGGQS